MKHQRLSGHALAAAILIAGLWHVSISNLLLLTVFLPACR